MTDNPRHLRASEIFQKAIELPEDQRDAYVREACQSDEDLLLEVRSLLSYDGPEPRAIHTPFPVVEPQPLPDRFGRYEILGKIGEGGMGEVWKAWDPQLERHVALKFLPPDLARSEAIRSRFLREGRNASTLKHAGIATVFDAGEIEGRDYIAFEFVDGKTVTQYVREGLLPAAEAIKVTIAACDALAYAHDRNVIHRDITSNNIMITNDGNVVIVDFGLAIAEGADKVTRSGAVVGTVAYMSPESLTGGEPDARVDIYGLGVVLYEMLTGALPFDNKIAYAIQYMIVNEMPKLPGEHNKDLPPEVDAVVMKALAKDPTERYQTAREFMDALEALVRPGLLPDVPRDSVIVRRFIKSPVQIHVLGWRVRRRVVVAAAAVVIAVVTSLVLMMTREDSYSTVAVLPIEITGPDTDIPTWMTSGLGRGLVTKLNRLEGIRVVTWASSQRFLPSQSRPKEIAAELGVAALVLVNLQRVGDRFDVGWELVDGRNETVRDSGTFEAMAGDLFAIEGGLARAIAARLLRNVQESTAGMLASPASKSLEAYEFYLKGSEAMQTDTPEANSRAIAYFEKALELDPDLADAMVGVGAVLMNRYFFGWDAGWNTLQRSKQYFEKALATAPDNRDALRGLISASYEMARPLETLSLGQQAPVGASARVEDLLARGQSYILGGLPSKSTDLLRRAAEIEPYNPAVRFWLVVGESWSAMYQEAIEDGSVYLDKFGDDGEIHYWIANSYWDSGQPEEAYVHFRRSLDLFGDNPTDYVELNVAEFYRATGRNREADQLLRHALGRLEKVVSASPENPRYVFSLAECYAALGDTTRFLETAEQLRSLPAGDQGPLILGYAMLGFYREAIDAMCTVARGEVGFWIEFVEEDFRAYGELVHNPEFNACRELVERNLEKLGEKY